MNENLKQFLEIDPEVADALKNGRPVVALESTIIAHGMPFPLNVETALKVNETIRKNGAVPATIGIIKGKLKVGLSEEDINYIAKASDVLKVSRRDIPYVVSKGHDGATTVAATMIIAEMAGIRVFVTGGIGGVHRGAGDSFDVSADLEEMKKSDVVVVCAGAKSILDIGATLEYLETSGVPVIGYQTDEFPAFYSRKSSFKVECRADSPKEIADQIRIKYQMDLHGGMLIACPIPEEDEISYEIMDEVIREALTQADEEGITGKRITPYLLNEIKNITGGKSLEANIKLVLNNALIGASIAAELAAARR